MAGGSSSARPIYTRLMVWGLGCPFTLSDDDDDSGLYEDSFCNRSLGATLRDIGAQLVCKRPPSYDNPFVQTVLARVREVLDEKPQNHVLLIGVSYGGAVATRVAELVYGGKSGGEAHAERAKRLHVATFGSIYVPKAAELPGMDICHYMFYNDVALHCNGLEAGDTRAVWLRSEDDPTFGKRKPGLRTQWRIHTDYRNHIVQALEQRTTRVKADIAWPFEEWHLCRVTRDGAVELLGMYRITAHYIKDIVHKLGWQHARRETEGGQIIVAVVINRTLQKSFMCFDTKTDCKFPRRAVEEMLEANTCKHTMGVMQTSRTCWFNAALNTLMLSERGRQLLEERLGGFLRALSDTDRLEFFKSSTTNNELTCPLTVKGAYLFAAVYNTLRHGALPRRVNMDRMVREAGLRPAYVTTGWGFAPAALRSLYSSLAVPAAVVEGGFTGLVGLRALGKDALAAAAASQVIALVPSTLNMYFDVAGRVPKHLKLNNSRFVLDSACIVLRSGGNIHYITGFFADKACGGKPLLFDSNGAVLSCDWTRPAGELQACLAKQYDSGVQLARHALLVYFAERPASPKFVLV